ncbi:hypothetical protein HanXRQr2_Chr15g0706551 [Helianthus annuus]|uniref:Uncharacterized protein n=1 Tax=Helianthus annuus TaxID=4232 RepID=A0A251VJU6_HELAN|nr:hypothetical protein HanXRQr2_Chr15g0706551 [Helianthus annuus]KAJ0832381.1 hypothetical protein HanPSC8_Chr15g0678151 [Helianthus annuus]
MSCSKLGAKTSSLQSEGCLRIGHFLSKAGSRGTRRDSNLVSTRAEPYARHIPPPDRQRFCVNH